MQLAPLPSHAVPAPPWANYNTRVSILRSMKMKLGQMDGEVYPPGQNPGYFNPWVTMPYPLQPAPNTPQYGGPWTTARQRKEVPKDVRAGWVWVQVRSKMDVEHHSFSDKLREGDRLYAQLEGWFLSFYTAAAAAAAAVRITALDLRNVRRAELEAMGSAIGSLVSLVLETGSFDFFVASQEEAQAWCSAITQRVLTWQQQRGHRQEKQLEEQLEQPEHEFMRRAPLPGALRQAWAACVKAVAQGLPVPLEPFELLFQIYDADGNEALSFAETRRMLRDLLELRRKEAEYALAQQDERLRCAKGLDAHAQSRLADAARRAASLGAELLAGYSSKLSPDVFEARCLLLQSQLDLSADRFVALPEFLAAAPKVLLHLSELKEEAKFYQGLAVVLRIVKAQVAVGDGEEGICVHQ